MKFKTRLLLPVMAVFSSNSTALDWLFHPDFSANERYTDNVTMQANSAFMVSSMITTLSPGVLLGYQAENNELKTRFKWNELIYHNASDLDFSEKMLDVGHQFKAERFRTNLDASYYEQSSINTQLVDPTQRIAGQTLVPRYTRSISPDITYYLTEKNSLQLGYSYQDVTFDRQATVLNPLGFSDYTSQQFSSTLTHTYSDRLSFNLVGAYSLYDSSISYPLPQNRFITNNYTQKSNTFFYQAGFQYAFDELTQLSLSAGMRNTDNKTRIVETFTYAPEITISEIDRSNKASGYVFSANLSRKGEWGNVNLNAGQQLLPSSSGSQSQVTSVSAQANYNLDDRWSTGMNADYYVYDSTSVFNTINTNFNSVYTALLPHIQWRWTPDINLKLSYSFAQNEYTSSHQTAVGNSIQLQFSYQPQINRQVK